MRSMRMATGGTACLVTVALLASSAVAGRTALVPAGLADPHSGWSAYGGSSDSAQFSALTQITRANVNQLEQAWMVPLPTGTSVAGPIVVNDIMYVVADKAIVALDAATGRMVWSAAESGSRARGLVYWESPDHQDRRILVTRNDELIALDAATGARIMNFGTNGATNLKEGLGIPLDKVGRIQSGTPGRIYQDLLILGSSPGEGYGSAPGDVRAYNVRTGKLAWTFKTIPDVGDYGYDSWPKGALPRSYAGGANVWGEMTVDAKRGIVFLPTGSSTYDFYGVDRIGNNLFADSLIALDAKTGKRLWHFQTVHHDLWDYDNVQAPKLLTLKRNGKPVDVVAMAGKTGFIYTFIRDTGKPFFPIVERPVPASDVPGEVASRTQPFPLLPPPFARQKVTAADINPLLDAEDRAQMLDIFSKSRNEGIFTPPSLRGTIQMPGNHGGGQYGNGAVNAATGRFYVASIEHTAVIKLEPRPPAFRMSMLGATPDVVFSGNCAMCHGKNAEGQAPAIPRLRGIGKSRSMEEFIETVKKGRGQMPAFANLADSQLFELYMHLTRIDDPSGRPAAPVVAAAVAQADPLAAIHGTGDSPPSTGGEARFYSGYNFLTSKDGMPAISPPWSVLTAYDMNKGTILWRKPYGFVETAKAKGLDNTGSFFSKGSLVATASGLLFSATADGMLRAWDADTGKVLWEKRLPAKPQAIPAIYSVNGRQFIAVTAAFSNSAMSVAAKSATPEQNTFIAFALPERLMKRGK